MDTEKDVGNAASASTLLPIFEAFRAELDEHHDRRERIIKASRDITAASKKIVRKLNAPLPQNVVKGNKQYYDTISTQFSSVSSDLQGLNAHRYGRQISGGCQEYIEAASFEHYLQTANILPYEDAAAQMKQLDSDGPGVELSPEDYLLGIYDMTGELMRFAVTSMATNGSLPTISSTNDAAETDPAPNTQRNLLTDMRDLRSALESLDAGTGPFARDADKKMDVMRASVEKVEKALYGLTVRGAERPKGWMPDTSTGRALEVEG
ncbi:hypothetical protein LTR37_009508 [Vermiconidia calcicola]|uniref:Uncharacterized protein n=1 Tax=Vermiconidia calcicola TaxID=1690605 RepID=A0ACC3N923_9PEZI|nr:hypothetical protein LTR37_009508 [Vermiconidia calcicola]